MVPPEAAVRDAEARVLLALPVDPVGPVAHRQVGPVVVLPALRGGELLPPLLRVLPLRVEQRPQRGGVDHHAVVEVGGVAGVLLARRALAVGRRRAPVGALLDVGDERLQLVPGLEYPVVLPLGVARGLLVGAVAGGAQVGQLAVEAGERRHEVVGEQHPQGLLVHPVDVHPGDEGLAPTRRAASGWAGSRTCPCGHP